MYSQSPKRSLKGPTGLFDKNQIIGIALQLNSCLMKKLFYKKMSSRPVLQNLLLSFLRQMHASENAEIAAFSDACV